MSSTLSLIICGVPRVFEKVYASVMAKAEAGSPVKKKIFHWAVGVGKQVSQLKQARQSAARGDYPDAAPAGCGWA